MPTVNLPRTGSRWGSPSAGDDRPRRAPRTSFPLTRLHRCSAGTGRACSGRGVAGEHHDRQPGGLQLADYGHRRSLLRGSRSADGRAWHQLLEHRVARFACGRSGSAGDATACRSRLRITRQRRLLYGDRHRVRVRIRTWSTSGFETPVDRALSGSRQPPAGEASSGAMTTRESGTASSAGKCDLRACTLRLRATRASSYDAATSSAIRPRFGWTASKSGRLAWSPGKISQFSKTSTLCSSGRRAACPWPSSVGLPRRPLPRRCLGPCHTAPAFVDGADLTVRLGRSEA